MSLAKRLINQFYIFVESWFPNHNTPTILETGRLRGFTTEAPYIAERRKKSIEYLRSFTPSKYVLDGAEVKLYEPTVLVSKYVANTQNPT